MCCAALSALCTCLSCCSCCARFGGSGKGAFSKQIYWAIMILSSFLAIGLYFGFRDIQLFAAKLGQADILYNIVVCHCGGSLQKITARQIALDLYPDNESFGCLGQSFLAFYTSRGDFAVRIPVFAGCHDAGKAVRTGD